MSKQEWIPLARYFLHHMKGFPYSEQGKIMCPADYKTEVLEDIGELLTGETVTAEELWKLFQEEPLEKVQHLHKPSDLIRLKGMKVTKRSIYEKDNLVLPGVFYYHPRLQITPSPPVLTISDDGTIEASYEKEEPFYLEMIERFTVEDLLLYFYEKRYMPGSEGHSSRDKGAFLHLLQLYSLDFLLFLIDEAFTCARDYGEDLPVLPFDIEKYVEEAKLTYQSRKRMCFEEGIDHVFTRADRATEPVA